MYKKSIKNITSNILKGILILIPFVMIFFLVEYFYDLIYSIYIYLFSKTNSIITTILVSFSTILIFYLIGLQYNKYKRVIFLNFLENILKKIPLINNVYNITKDIIGMFNTDDTGYLGVVYVKFGIENKTKMIGFITKKDKDDLYIFVPTTPNPTSGLLLIMKESEVEYIDMEVSDAMKTIISLGTSK